MEAQWLELSSSVSGIRYVKVVTTSSPSWVAWFEIEVYGPPVQWLVADQLGMPRMIFDQTGSLGNVKRHDYLPFGEELYAPTGGRTTAQGYTLDALRQQFTSYERDKETGLDYARARYYASIGGRFTSPDPLLSSGLPVQPQSWNRYAYCVNNPLIYNDPNGLVWGKKKTSDTNTEYVWFEGDEVGEGYDVVTEFYVEGVIDGRSVGLTLNPDGPRSWGKKLFLNGDPTLALMTNNSDYFVMGYQVGETKAQWAERSRNGAVDMMPNQPFDVGLALAGGGIGRLNRSAGLSMEGIAYELSFLNKHLPGTAQAQREIAGGSAQVFNDLSTLSRAESEIFSRGTYTGSTRDYARYGFRFDEPIGTRIGRNGRTTALDYGEMKLRSNGLYHLVPRTGPNQ